MSFSFSNKNYQKQFARLLREYNVTEREAFIWCCSTILRWDFELSESRWLELKSKLASEIGESAENFDLRLWLSQQSR